MKINLPRIVKGALFKLFGSPKDVCYGDPLLQEVTFHEGDEEWHDGPGWYYTINDYPDEGSCGAFKSCADAMEHAEESFYGTNLES
jgi:hypothetical protein